MSQTYDVVVKNGDCVTPLGRATLDIALQGEVIAALGHDLHGATEMDAHGLLVLPGAVDGHVHLGLKLPAFTTVDDFRTGTQAAAIGGVTTVIDFATPSPGQGLLDALALRRTEADGVTAVDYGLHVCLVSFPEGLEREVRTLPEHGVSSVKLFTNYTDRGWQADDAALYRTLRLSAATGLRVLVHAENDDLITLLQHELTARTDAATLGAYAHALTRPPVTEREAVQRVITWATDTGGHLFIVHISTAGAARLVREARAAGTDVVGETCPQYLTLDDTLLAGPQGYLYATCPPLRGAAEQHALRQELARGGLQVIGTDTCSFSAAQKATWGGDYRRMAFGLPGVDLLVPLTYQLVEAGLIDLQHWVELIATTPARVHGLYPRKGALLPGSDADLVLFDPRRSVTLAADTLATASDSSPYLGHTMTGWPVATIARGQVIAREGRFIGTQGRGRYLPRSTMRTTRPTEAP